MATRRGPEPRRTAKEEPMTPRPDHTLQAASVRRRGAAPQPRRASDDPWSLEVSRLMHEAAEERERRDRARAVEDESAARHDGAALMAMIRARVQPSTRALSPDTGRGAGGDRRR